jgi:hypothetical protein
MLSNRLRCDREAVETATHGQGDGAFAFGVATANPGPGKRIAYVAVNARSLAIEQDAPPAPPLEITSTSLSAGTTGNAYSDFIRVSGGIAPYVFTAPSVSVPPGLRLASNTGSLEGIPQLSGVFALTVTVTALRPIGFISGSE